MAKPTNQEELAKRGAAGLARTTAGLSKTIPNEKLYKRNRAKAEANDVVEDLTYDPFEGEDYCPFYDYDEWFLREIGAID